MFSISDDDVLYNCHTRPKHRCLILLESIMHMHTELNAFSTKMSIAAGGSRPDRPRDMHGQRACEYGVLVIHGCYSETLRQILFSVLRIMALFSMFFVVLRKYKTVRSRPKRGKLDLTRTRGPAAKTHQV